ncbi:hypothetical protein EGT74_24880 [Chitinophaga lutea]|uniref:Outer membrane protein beta-barrel domain-containing protein n=1 Tax=Chitinophaga lutea TaxID=2488634 RepID=A0A3N4Q1H4_9BACT|nr:hypothetical protein [Chitinophaga lutea]RPE05614.1 hypothetical protein EGT74_24880 [Chitinophaga lutea]
MINIRNAGSILRAAGILTLLITLASSPANAQRDRWHMGFTATAGLAAKADINGDKRPFGLYSRRVGAFEGTFNAYLPLTGGFWITVGLGAGVTGHSIIYNVPKEAFTPPMNYDLTNLGAGSREMDLVYAKLPVEVEKRWMVKHRRHWHVAAGVSLLYASPIDVSMAESVWYNNGYYIFKSGEWNSDNHRKPWMTYHLSGGHTWKFRYGHSIRASLKGTLSFTDATTGTYRFTLPDKPVEGGTFSFTGSYLGVSVSYLFTR